MASGIIPEDARQFLLQSIDSIAEWECLLLLRAHPEKAWGAHEACLNLYISEDATDALLAKLAKRGMLRLKDKTYQYAPEGPDMAAMIDKVAALYGQYLIPVTQIIHAKGKSRVQEFANSFKLRKD